MSAGAVIGFGAAVALVLLVPLLLVVGRWLDAGGDR